MQHQIMRRCGRILIYDTEILRDFSQEPCVLNKEKTVLGLLLPKS